MGPDVKGRLRLGVQMIRSKSVYNKLDLKTYNKYGKEIAAGWVQMIRDKSVYNKLDLDAYNKYNIENDAAIVVQGSGQLSQGKRRLTPEAQHWLWSERTERYGKPATLAKKGMRSIWELGTESGHLPPGTKFETVRSFFRRQNRAAAADGAPRDALHCSDRVIQPSWIIDKDNRNFQPPIVFNKCQSPARSI